MLQFLQRATPTWLLCALGLAVGWLNLSLVDPAQRSVLMGSTALAAWLLAALGAFARARMEPDRGSGWRLVGLAFTVTTLFSTLALARTLHGLSATPPPASMVFITWGTLVLLGMAWFRFQPGLSRNQHWVGLALDVGNFLASLLLAYWLIFLRTFFVADHFPLLDRVSTLGLPFGVAGLAGLFGRAACWYEHGFRGPMGFYSLALLLMALNLPFLETFLARRPFLGHPAQVGMIPVWLLAIAASRRPFPDSRRFQLLARIPLRDLFSYAPLAIAIPALLYSTLVRKTLLDPFAMALLVIILLCLATRQLLALGQLRELNRTLEDRVEARSRELSEAQACLVRTERMNVIATLGAGVAHDINNFLSTALASTELVLDDPDLPSASRGDLDRIRRATEKAGALTKRLLAFGREITGPLAFDPRDRIQHLAPILRSLVPRRIELREDLEGGGCLLGDPQAFDQVLVNLVSNARDAIPDRGRIQLRSRNEPGDFLLEVADTGAGIPPEVLARVFEPFFTTKPLGVGTGLGLSSTKVIVEGFGGRIDVESVPGKGSAFRVRIPLRAAGG